MPAYPSPLSPVCLHYPTDHNPPIVPRPDPVVRWDIYDIADDLADLTPLINRNLDNPRKLKAIARYIQIRSNELFKASRVAGKVGCSPDYKQEV
jgi:hypothetical protein